MRIATLADCGSLQLVNPTCICWDMLHLELGAAMAGNCTAYYLATVSCEKAGTL